MPDRRAVVVGLGVVAPAAIGATEFWKALTESRRAVGPISLFDPSSFPSKVGGQLVDFSARNYVPKDYRKAVKVMARDIEIAMACADLAFRDSGIVTQGIDPANVTIESSRLGCNIGAGLICTDLNELGSAVVTAVEDGKFSLRAWGSSGMNNLTPLWLLKYLPNMLACHVTIVHACKGPSNNITCSDASGHLGIGESARWIIRGDADVVVAGGAESKLNPMGLLRQTLLKRVVEGEGQGPESCRPFDSAARGTVAGEGGGLVILEEADRAARRGARVYAELAGAGAACDPNGIEVLKPNVGGLDLAVKNALADAGIGPEDVDLIVAHGTAVPGEDKLEAQAWASALGDAAERIPALTITGGNGSLFAGAGGVELSAAALSIANQVVPPTVNFARAADGVKLNLSDKARPAKIRYALTAAFSTGGQSAACVLKKCE